MSLLYPCRLTMLTSSLPCSYPELCELLDFLGAERFATMHTSVTSAWQFVEAIDRTLVEHLKSQLAKCSFVGLSMDESTSRAVQKYLSVDCHAWLAGVGRMVHVLEFCMLSDCTAQGVYDVVVKILDKFEVNHSKFVGAASDGASVFTGTVLRCVAVLAWPCANTSCLLVHRRSQRLSCQDGSDISLIPGYS